MKAFTFKGGIHPSYHKEATASEHSEVFQPPDELIIPLSQHIGAPATPVVQKGDAVLMGQMIAQAGGFISVPIHSPVSGSVVALEKRPGPMGIDVDSIIISNDKNDTQASFVETNWQGTSVENLKELVSVAGIVGMGGATFPTHVKLSPPENKPIDTVILNGAECEPYITADHRIMLESTAEIIEGLLIIQKILGAKKAMVAIEQNKQDALLSMAQAAKGKSIEVVALKVKYPQGGEKQLIDATLKRIVPSGSLPMDVGVVVQNVATAKAICDAVKYGKPLIERIVTVTGSGVLNPGNFKVRIGTLVSKLLEHCKVKTENLGKIILGGPMMGMAQSGTDIPVIKGTSAILALDKKESQIKEVFSCIKCGSCIRVCPMMLVPSAISVLCDNGLFEEATEARVTDCMECGSCAHDCPSRIPLVQKIRLVKAQVANIQRQRRSANS